MNPLTIEKKDAWIREKINDSLTIEKETFFFSLNMKGKQIQNKGQRSNKVKKRIIIEMGQDK